MKKTPMIIRLLARIVMAFAATASFGQSPTNTAYIAFDHAIQTKNAAFNNGKIHFNQFRPADKTYRYYNSADFIQGDIVYDGQLYANLSVKYDLLRDELIVRLDGEGNQMGFSPVKQRTGGFYIGAVKFSNLDLAPHPKFVSGFYEETGAGTIILYTKYAKDQFPVLTGETTTYTYTDRNEFVLFYQNSWYRVNSERDVTDAFPQFERQIAKFFRDNAPLEKADRRQFMKKLVSQLDELLNTVAK